MSVVTDLILTGQLGEIRLHEVNLYFEDEHGLAVMHKVDKPDEAAGKAIQADIYIGAFNYLDLGGFLEHLRSLDWDCGRDGVRLFVQFENDEHGFHEVQIFKGETDGNR